jgi:hypothetical protein
LVATRFHSTRSASSVCAWAGTAETASPPSCSRSGVASASSAPGDRRGGDGHGRRAEEVGLHDRARPCFGCLLDRANDAVAGIVDQDINPSEPRQRGGDGSFDAFRAIDIELKGQHAIGCFGDQFLELRDVAASRDHVAAARQGVGCKGMIEAR